jgi:hypothetical protein
MNLGKHRLAAADRPQNPSPLVIPTRDRSEAGGIWSPTQPITLRTSGDTTNHTIVPLHFNQRATDSRPTPPLISSRCTGRTLPE